MALTDGGGMLPDAPMSLLDAARTSAARLSSDVP